MLANGLDQDKLLSKQDALVHTPEIPRNSTAWLLTTFSWTKQMQIYPVRNPELKSINQNDVSVRNSEKKRAEKWIPLLLCIHSCLSKISARS